MDRATFVRLQMITRHCSRTLPGFRYVRGLAPTPEIRDEIAEIIARVNGLIGRCDALAYPEPLWPKAKRTTKNRHAAEGAA
jgi:hypothetical protein